MRAAEPEFREEHRMGFTIRTLFINQMLNEEFEDWVPPPQRIIDRK